MASSRGTGTIIEPPPPSACQLEAVILMFRRNTSQPQPDRLKDERWLLATGVERVSTMRLCADRPSRDKLAQTAFTTHALVDETRVTHSKAQHLRPLHYARDKCYKHNRGESRAGARKGM